MQKNKIKILKILLLFCLILVFFKTYTYASYSISDIFTDAQNFAEAGNTVDSMISVDALKDTSTFIFRLLYSIGMVVAIAVGIVLGIQFMVAGSEEKAKIKETLIAYVVGCVVLFGAYNIWRLVINIVKNITTI